MADFADLPTLVLNEIFKYLNCNDRTRCKRVCKRWYNEIELRNQKCLAIHLNQIIDLPFYYDKELIKIENNLIVESVDILFKSDFKQQFKNIKKNFLYVHPRGDHFDITKFNRFQKIFNQIEYLQLYGHRFHSVVSINLPQLKDLILFGDSDHSISINCPSLLKLTIGTETKIEINLIESKKLKYFHFSDPNKFVPNAKLIELECLVIYNDINEIDNQLLNYYPGLKKLVWYTSNARMDLKKLNKQKKRYGLKGLKILINGFEESKNFIPQFEISHNHINLTNQESIEILFNGYSKLIHRLDNAIFDYNLLFDKFKILPNDFFDKFQKIYQIKIRSVRSYNHLREFLKSIPSLMAIELNPSELDIRFLDQLYLLLPSTNELIVTESNPETLDYDLTFLLNLNILFFTFISNLLPVDLIRKVVKNCKNLRLITFLTHTIKLIIDFHSRPIHLYLNEDPPLEFKNLNLLIKHLKSQHPFNQITI